MENGATVPYFRHVKCEHRPQSATYQQIVHFSPHSVHRRHEKAFLHDFAVKYLVQAHLFGFLPLAARLVGRIYLKDHGQLVVVYDRSLKIVGMHFYRYGPPVVLALIGLAALADRRLAFR